MPVDARMFNLCAVTECEEKALFAGWQMSAPPAYPRQFAAWLMRIIHLLFQIALAPSAEMIRARPSSSCAAQPLASCLLPSARLCLLNTHLPPNNSSLPHPPHTQQHTHPLQQLPHHHPSTTPHHTRAITRTTANMQIFVKTRTFTPLHRRMSTSRWRRMLTHSQSRERPSPSRLSPRTLSTM